MSTWFDESVTCPTCGLVQTARLAHGVHVARAPEVREQMFERTFHRIACRGCGGGFIAQRSVLYTDMDRRHWLQVARPIERPRWPELEPAATATFERAFATSPIAAELRDDFKLRLVFGFEELREKLVVWRAGLDDRVIECVKVLVVSREPALLRADSIIVDDVGADRSLALAVDGDRRLAVDGAVVDRFHDDPSLPERFPELFGGRFVSIHRLLGHRYRWAEPRD
jgi:CpXC protein